MVRPRKGQTIYSEDYTGIEPPLGRTKTTRKTTQRIVARDRQEILGEKKEQRRAAKSKISELADMNPRIIYSAKTVFPFDFFPDTIVIRPTKVEVVQGIFFLSNQVESIPMQDIAHIAVEKIPFFATLRITNIRKRDKPIVLRFLKPFEALKAKKIIEGLLIAQEAGTDVSTINPNTISDELEKIGEITE
jgi:hypothetical protein